MLPEIKLQGDVDVAALSPLVRGMLLSVAYADGEGGIGLTATGAMNRKFVHWAAVNFLWPDFTAKDLYSMHKVLNESDMPPLWVVRDMARHLKLLRRKKNVLLPTKRGREFLLNPQAFFDLVATDYLYSYVHVTDRPEDVQARLRWWRMFLNLLNIKAREGCTPLDVVKILNPDFAPLSDTEMTLEAWELKIRCPIWRPEAPVLARPALRGTRRAHDFPGWILPQDATLVRLPAAGIGYTKRHRGALNVLFRRRLLR
ncbi:hypothetical protein SAMN05421750_12041 [Agrobacterium pusense]|nr:hypothetical protein SAMN05421750_12041 [Agrobacterium pusense]